MMSLLPPRPLSAKRVRVLRAVPPWRASRSPRCFDGRVARRRLEARPNSCERRPSRITYRARIDCNKFEAGVAPAWQPVFERSDNVTPVATESAVIAVVKHNDVAMSAARAPGSREPCDQTLGRLRLPVPANPGPHHDSLDAGAANLSIQ